MSWLLILTFIGPDGQGSQAPVGIMANQDACIVAGAGSEIVLEGANPGLDVSWSCIPETPEAGA